MQRYLLSLITLCGLLCASMCPPASAQATPSTEASSGDWRFDVAPMYLWLPALDGDVTVRGRTSSVNVSMGKFIETLLDSFKFAATGRFEAHRGDLLLTLDLIYMRFEEDGETPGGLFQTNVEFSNLITEFGGGYRLGEWSLGAGTGTALAVEVLGGGRYVRLDGDLEIAGAGPLGARVDVDGTVDWIEPFVGARLRLILAENLAFVVRGDAGGFGLGSNLTWSLVASVQTQISRKVTLVFGYRLLDIDYDEGSGTSRFVYDVLMHGPMFGAVLRF